MLSSGSRQSWSSSKHFSCQLFICSLGYESRSTALLTRGILDSEKVIALQFAGPQEFSFESNREILTHCGALFVSNDRQSISDVVREALAELAEKHSGKIGVAVDVSSMNRTMIASVLYELLRQPEILSELRIFYIPAAFEEPSLQFPKIEQVGPVVPVLSGFDADPSLPLTLLMGLGFEYGIALGITHQLEPQTTICFRAIGSDSRYEDAVRKANSDFDFSPFIVNVTDYSLLEPVLAIKHIDNVVAGILPSSRLIMIPMGPKILATYFILTAIKNWGRIAVWRISYGTSRKDALPADEFIETTVALGEFAGLSSLSA